MLLGDGQCITMVYYTRISDRIPEDKLHRSSMWLIKRTVEAFGVLGVSEEKRFGGCADWKMRVYPFDMVIEYHVADTLSKLYTSK
jgi:hypothetical protein